MQGAESFGGLSLHDTSCAKANPYQQVRQLPTFHQKNMSVKCIPPLTPLLYTHGETGVYKGIHFFLFLIQDIDCGYSLEPPRRGGSNVYPQFMF